MIPSQTEVKYRGSSKCFAAWWPLFEGPADFPEDIDLIGKLFKKL
jgi:hypothetical protein